jgi:hypothetical protein
MAIQSFPTVPFVLEPKPEGGQWACPSQKPTAEYLCRTPDWTNRGYDRAHQVPPNLLGAQS